MDPKTKFQMAVATKLAKLEVRIGKLCLKAEDEVMDLTCAGNVCGLDTGDSVAVEEVLGNLHHVQAKLKKILAEMKKLEREEARLFRMKYGVRGGK